MLAIFDMSTVNIKRYNSELFKSRSGQYIAYVDDPDLCVAIDDMNCHLVCSGWWTISRFINHFKENGVSVIIVSGQRTADLRVLIAASVLAIPVSTTSWLRCKALFAGPCQRKPPRRCVSRSVVGRRLAGACSR